MISLPLYNMNLFIYLRQREINSFLKKPVVIILQRPWTDEFKWYIERLS